MSLETGTWTGEFHNQVVIKDGPELSVGTLGIFALKIKCKAEYPSFECNILLKYKNARRNVIKSKKEHMKISCWGLKMMFKKLNTKYYLHL